MVKRNAFTFIELIFAIVIIAISVVSLPMMNQAISKGIDSNIVQEAIFAAATELNEAISANWDANSTDPTSPNSYARVIDLGGCETNSSLNTYRQMSGHINQPLHRKCLNSDTTVPADINVAGITSIDSMQHSYQNIFINATSNQQGYKRIYTSELNVSRPANFNGSNQNIKEILITIKDSSTGTIVTSLKTYSANIGEIDYYKRGY